MTRQWEGQSAVRSVSFDRATRTLRVELEDGLYDFADVPERLYDELARSVMPDEFFREHIRDEFTATRAGDVDLAELAHERREDALLGAPMGEGASEVPTDREVPLGSADSGYGTEHTWVIDVIDDDSAAVQVDGRQITPLPRWLLPADAHDGDILRVTHARSAGRSSLSIELDRSATRTAFQRSADQVRGAPDPGA
ncbi:MAG TPA: KTSC domain-containing protein [Gemmatimonadaceae bacterium]|nr:KTSC domain-containing protein [Gemmatimonadaceae bacterium]